MNTSQLRLLPIHLDRFPFIPKANLITLFGLFLCLFPGCAGLSGLFISGPPLSDPQVASIVSMIRMEEEKVTSFYTIGKILFQEGLWEEEADILIVGIKSPLKIKIEVTHSWGQPLVHILLSRGRLEALSFPDKKAYEGQFSPKALSRFFPGELDADLIWGALRGFPFLQAHHRAGSSKAYQITLYDDKGKETEILRIDPDTLLPRQVFFPDRNMDLAFSGYLENEGIRYARKVKVVQRGSSRGLLLDNEKMVFNKAIPDEIFLMERPPGFEILPLEEQ